MTTNITSPIAGTDGRAAALLAQLCRTHAAEDRNRPTAANPGDGPADGAAGGADSATEEAGSAAGVSASAASGGPRTTGESPDDRAGSPLIHVERVSEGQPRSGPWPEWVPVQVRDAFTTRGVVRPWSHQLAAAQLARRGASVVLATGTASGKSLAYQMVGLAALHADDRARVLYLSPTKALAADQLRTLKELALPRLRAATYDGDTPPDEREWVRAHANWVLTNPDMLSRALLPGHRRWTSFLRRLQYVVLDECHAYRGLFGAHTAAVVRRLRRVCATYGADPVFVLASGTVADPAVAGQRLIGSPVQAVTEDTSGRGERLFAFWEPPLTLRRGMQDAPTRRPAGGEAARLMADLVASGARTLAFVRSRRGAELTAMSARRCLVEAGAPELAERVAAYRGGYLPEERRAVERDLTDGRLLGVAATNALELGVDISGLDAVVLAGYPGTLASFWQQAGRAGRSGHDALVVFVARDDPLDTYLVHHPEAIFGRPVESSVFDPVNPYVLAGQLCCAAAELPLTENDLASFGGRVARTVLDQLVAAGSLRRRPSGWYWTAPNQPRVNLREGLGEPVTIVERSTGALLGTVDGGAAHSAVHEGAVYLHRGRSYLVDQLNLDDHVAVVHDDAPDWTTSAQEITDITVVEIAQGQAFDAVGVYSGVVDVSSRVVSYQRRRISSGEVLDEIPLDLPVRRLRTRAVWYTVEQAALDAVDLPAADVGGAVHAAEHAAIGLLPLFATCDRWDIGGVSTALHPDTGRPTVFVYDGYPGGAGFADRGHAVLGRWLRATREAIAGCECASGCPSCVQSPKCGSGNAPLDKAGALRLLDLLLRALTPAPPG